MFIKEDPRIKIKGTRLFTWEAGRTPVIEDCAYPGDEGKVFDLEMTVEDRTIRILLFDTDYGRKELLCGRFIHGKSARKLYYNTCQTVSQTLQCYFPDVLGYVERAREHQILRAGRALSLAPFIEGLTTQGDDFKRKPVSDGELFTADATGKINWGPETTRIFSDICPASGSTMAAFVKKALAETRLEKIIFNTSTTTINSIYRMLPSIPREVEVILICWEALFSVWRENVTLPGGEVIHGGTIINLNPDPDFPKFEPIAPREVVNFIHRIFQRDRVPLLPDIPGEVGEKIQDHWIGPYTYDFLELYNAGINLLKEPWYKKAKTAWNMPGVQENLKLKSPEVYRALRKMFGQNPRQRQIRELVMI